jgi:hypothetical protein
MQLLIDRGWTVYYQCHCGGSLKQHWSNPAFQGYEIRTRPRRQTFEIRSRNIRIYGPDFQYALEGALKKFNIYEVVQSQ